MKRRTLVFTLLGMLALLCLAVPLWAAGTTLGPVGPAVVVTGQEFQVNIEVRDVQGLMGTEFKLAFDPALLEVLEVTKGNVFSSPLEVEKTIDNSAGFVEYGAIVLSASDAFSGTGNAAVVKFNAKAVGSSALTLSNTLLGAEGGASISHTTFSATVTIQAPDTDPPTVTGTDPANNAAGVPVNKTITVTFSENVLQGANFGDIALKDAGNNTVAATKSITGKVLTINPDADLFYNTAFTATIPAGAVKDAADNILASVYTFGFTTEQENDITAPTVTGTDPANNATGVPVNKTITVTFSENVLQGANFGDIALKDAGNNTVAATKSIT
ncbi:MAG: Ig-like domain-containing protein, partial [Bacillota bacterium]